MKEIIYDFSKSRARNAQHVQFVTDILAAVPEATATAQGFASQRAALATAAADELDCFQPDKAYLGTPEIESTDRRRDNTARHRFPLLQGNRQCLRRLLP